MAAASESEENESDPLMPQAQDVEASTYTDIPAGDDDDDQDDTGHQDDETVFSAVVENLESIANVVIENVHISAEAIAGEMQDAADAFIEELHMADEEEDKYFILEMQLTRNLSILPADVVDASEMVNARADRECEKCSKCPSQFNSCKFPSDIERAGHQAPSEKTALIVQGSKDSDSVDTMEGFKKPEVSTGVPISAFVLLASAVLALSAIGPLLQMQDNVGSTMKVVWRTSATSCLLFPLAAHSVYTEGVPQLTRSQWFELFIASGSYAALCVFFVWSLNYTAVGNAVILSNSQALMLLVGKVFVGTRVSTMEGTGALVAFVGAVLCSKSSSEASNGTAGGAMMALLGDLFALLSALAGVAYLVFAKAVRPTMNVYVFMFVVMSIGSLQTLIFLFAAGEPVSFDADLAHGVFGWTRFEADRLPLEIAMALVCNCFGALGYVKAMHYFDNLVISVAALMEPVVAEFLSFFLNGGSLPDWIGWLGNILVACGTLAVVYQPPGEKSAAHSH